MPRVKTKKKKTTKKTAKKKTNSKEVKDKINKVLNNTKPTAKPETKKSAVSDDDAWFDPGDSSAEFLKAEPGKVTRVALMATPHIDFVSYIEDNKIGWVKTLSEYKKIDGVGINVTEIGYDQELTGKQPELRCIVPVIVYEVGKDGQMGKRQKPDTTDYSFKLWSMSEPIYKRLLAQYKTWGQEIFDHDLLLNGTKKGNFEFFDDISVAKDCIALDPDIAEDVTEAYSAFKYADNYADMVAREFTEEELREKVEDE